MSLQNLLIGAVLLLFSTNIGDEPPAELALPSRPKNQEDHKKHLKGGQLNRGKVSLVDSSSISKKKFIQSFRQQALDVNLEDCLRSGGSQTGSAVIAAQLKQKGNLENVRSVEKTSQVPDCALDLIGKMKFVDSGKEIKGASHQVMWRVDW